MNTERYPQDNAKKEGGGKQLYTGTIKVPDGTFKPYTDANISDYGLGTGDLVAVQGDHGAIWRVKRDIRPISPLYYADRLVHRMHTRSFQPSFIDANDNWLSDRRALGAIELVVAFSLTKQKKPASKIIEYRAIPKSIVRLGLLDIASKVNELGMLVNDEAKRTLE